MVKIDNRLARLLYKKIIDTLYSDNGETKMSNSEEDELNSFLSKSEDNVNLLNEFVNNKLYTKKLDFVKRNDVELAYKELLKRRKRNHSKRIVFAMSAVAAVLVISFAIIEFFAVNTNQDMSVEYAKNNPMNNVILILEDGRSISLSDTSRNKQIDYAKISSDVINYNYESDTVQNNDDDEVNGKMNTIKTSVGGEYILVLSDGTKVFLNSMTTLRYPVKFNGDKREVYLDGEAYFEVAKDKYRQFRVYTDDICIKVYGTEFNVNTYDNVQTVLVNGSVGVNMLENSEELLMKPSQLLVFDKVSQNFTLKDVNVKQYIAWKDALFVFKDERLDDILEKLARWYDIEYSFGSEESKAVRFTGTFKRFNDVDVILKSFEATAKVKFNYNGKKIIIAK